MDEDPDFTELLKEPLFWLMIGVGLAVGMPLGFFVARQLAG